MALAVLATSAVALLGATEAHVGRIGALELRAAALWAAENHLAELTLGPGATAEPPPLMGTAFRLSAVRSATADPDLERVDITASDASDGRTLARLTGFLDTGTTTVTP